MQKLLKKFNCVLCGSKEGEYLYEFNTTVLINSKMTLWSYKHILCKKCAVIVVQPLPSKNILDQYYENAFPFELQNYEKRQINASNFVKKNIGKTQKKIFDIGAADGFLLNQFYKDGWKCSGIEPSKLMVDNALKKYQIKILNYGFEEFFQEETIENYDVVLMSHVLEHLYFPKEVIKNIRSILHSNGYLYIEVPSVEGFAKYNVNNEIMSFTHLWHFTIKSLTNFIEKQGFASIANECAIEENFPVIRSLFKKIEEGDNDDENIITVNNVSQVKNWFLKYIKLRDERKKMAIEKIKKLFLSDRQIVFYGAGQDMYDLMISEKELFKSKSFNLVDSNPSKWDKSLETVTIQNPKIIPSLNKPIVCITSRHVALKHSIKQSVINLESDEIEIEDLFE
jgi:SAM-dependent methyltransferase